MANRLRGIFVRYSLALVVAFFLSARPANAAFHLWNLNEIYTNSSGTLQFIELTTTFGGQQFVAGQQIQVHNLPNTITNSLTLTSNAPGDSTNHSYLIGTAGIQAAGAPAPDFIMPNGFLFSAGGTINFFGSNSGPYTALPTDGDLSRTWTGGNAVNSPKNFAGTTGHIVPEPATIFLLLVAGGAGLLRRRRSRIT
jgi:hypothetical protein